MGIPIIRDRVVQQALKNVIEPIFETEFLDSSFGYRTGRSAKQAIEQIEAVRDEGHEWVLDADIKAFFDTVNHEKLMDAVAERISDGRVLRLIRAFLKADIMEQGLGLRENIIGTPQGGVISPLDELELTLHPEKTKIKNLSDGVDFLGFTVYISHKVLRKEAVMIANVKWLYKGLDSWTRMRLRSF